MHDYAMLLNNNLKIKNADINKIRKRGTIWEMKCFASSVSKPQDVKDVQERWAYAERPQRLQDFRMS